jgi:hypothetical protein
VIASAAWASTEITSGSARELLGARASTPNIKAIALRIVEGDQAISEQAAARGQRAAPALRDRLFHRHQPASTD